MASKALSSFSAKPGVSLLPHGVTSSPSVMSIGFPRHNTGGRGVVVASSTVDTNNMPMTGVVFQPFEEVKKADLAIPITSHASLARQRYADASEALFVRQDSQPAIEMIIDRLSPTTKKLSLLMM